MINFFLSVLSLNCTDLWKWIHFMSESGDLKISISFTSGVYHRIGLCVPHSVGIQQSTVMQVGCRSTNMPMETYHAQVLSTDLSP